MAGFYYKDVLKQIKPIKILFTEWSALLDNDHHQPFQLGMYVDVLKSLHIKEWRYIREQFRCLVQASSLL